MYSLQHDKSTNSPKNNINANLTWTLNENIKSVSPKSPQIAQEPDMQGVGVPPVHPPFVEQEHQEEGKEGKKAEFRSCNRNKPLKQQTLAVCTNISMTHPSISWVQYKSMCKIKAQIAAQQHMTQILLNNLQFRWFSSKRSGNPDLVPQSMVSQATAGCSRQLQHNVNQCYTPQAKYTHTNT